MNRDIVGAHVSATHQAIVVEFPVLIAVGAIPLARRRMLPLILDAHRNTIVRIRPELFHELVMKFFGPLSMQESLAYQATFRISP